QTREVAVLPRGIRKMDFTKIFKAGLLASTSALALGVATGGANAQGFSTSPLLGIYGGVGFGWDTFGAHIKVHDTVEDETAKSQNGLSASGIIGSIFGGYRMPIAGPWVLGGEAKLNFGGTNGTFCGGPQGSGVQDCAGEHLTAHSKWGLNLSLQLGYL